MTKLQLQNPVLPNKLCLKVSFSKMKMEKSKQGTKKLNSEIVRTQGIRNQGGKQCNMQVNSVRQLGRWEEKENRKTENAETHRRN